ncbi:MAG TPA: hypothetical protein VFQ44_14010 [Streptosporangiaceae bacterium]|nr:hypothetical protein [Streptosporangiaceae bacterium]
MRILTLTALVTAIIAAGIVTAPASIAAPLTRATPDAVASPDVVLVNQPAASLCAGHKFKVGVWYQSLSGGSRAYRISIWGPAHRRFFYRQGKASPEHWKFWHVLAGRRGRYRVVYSGHKPGSAKWTKFPLVVHAKHCAS